MSVNATYIESLKESPVRRDRAHKAPVVGHRNQEANRTYVGLDKQCAGITERLDFEALDVISSGTLGLLEVAQE